MTRARTRKRWRLRMRALLQHQHVIEMHGLVRMMTLTDRYCVYLYTCTSSTVHTCMPTVASYMAVCIQLGRRTRFRPMSHV